MKVLLIGATGATGQELLPRLLDEGHEVTALVRRPEAVRAKRDRLTVVAGELRDPAALERAVAGQDAVVCAFGPRSLGRDDIQEVLMRNLVAAMSKHGVQRLVNLSAWGAASTAQYASPLQRFVTSIVLGRVFADKARGEEVLRASNLDYVNVSPGRLLNQRARGFVKASVDGKGLKGEMTRADLAAWMVAQLTRDTWVKKSPIIGY